MRPPLNSLAWLLVEALAGVCCSVTGPQQHELSPHLQASDRFASSHGLSIQGTLTQSAAGAADPSSERLSGLTQLDDGSWIRQDAVLNQAGQLLHAELVLGGTNCIETRRISLDARHGTVEDVVRGSRTSWHVPTDLPWVWLPVLLRRAGGTNEARPVATPLDAAVTRRGAMVARAVRRLDLDHLQSFSVMVDQVMDTNEHATTVVMGDDVAEFDAGVLQRLHMEALQVDLELVGEREALSQRAAAPGSRTKSCKAR